MVSIEGNVLRIGGEDAASWSDDHDANCDVVLSFAEAGTKAGTAISNGSTLDKAGTLTISVTDEAGNKAEKSITLTAQ